MTAVIETRAVLETHGLGKRYGRRFALRDCTLVNPRGQGRRAGRTQRRRQDHTAPACRRTPCGRRRAAIEVLGGRPGDGGAQLDRVGFVAQETPTYARVSVANHLRMGAWLNKHWDGELAQRRIGELGLDPRQRAGSLSGGQRAQLALTLAIAKRPEVLILDEPVASLDPLARRAFLQNLMEVVAERGVSVVLSSHLVADLERVCDYLVVLVDSQVQLAGDVDDATCIALPTVGSAPRRRLPSPRIRRSSRKAIQTSRRTLLVRTGEPISILRGS